MNKSDWLDLDPYKKKILILVLHELHELYIWCNLIFWQVLWPELLIIAELFFDLNISFLAHHN